jgi:hypothetical protein
MKYCSFWGLKKVKNNLMQNALLDTEENCTSGRTAIQNIQQQLSMVLSPKEILLILKLNIKQDLSSDEITGVIQNIKRQIQAEYPSISKLFIEPVSGIWDLIGSNTVLRTKHRYLFNCLLHK